MSNRTRLVAGAFVATAVAVPLYAAAVSTDSAQVTASPPCLAWFGNKDDGKCLSYSNGQPIYAGTPGVGVDGSNNPGGRHRGEHRPAAAVADLERSDRLAVFLCHRLRPQYVGVGVDGRQRDQTRIG